MNTFAETFAPIFTNFYVLLIVFLVILVLFLIYSAFGLYNLYQFGYTGDLTRKIGVVYTISAIIVIILTFLGLFILGI
jgi:heme/copper-type cytochrome/quinol oxidase subunit 2